MSWQAFLFDTPAGCWSVRHKQHSVTETVSLHLMKDRDNCFDNCSVCRCRCECTTPASHQVRLAGKAAELSLASHAAAVFSTCCQFTDTPMIMCTHIRSFSCAQLRLCAWTVAHATVPTVSSIGLSPAAVCVQRCWGHSSVTVLSS